VCGLVHARYLVHTRPIHTFVRRARGHRGQRRSAPPSAVSASPAGALPTLPAISAGASVASSPPGGTEFFYFLLLIIFVARTRPCALLVGEREEALDAWVPDAWVPYALLIGEQPRSRSASVGQDRSARQLPAPADGASSSPAGMCIFFFFFLLWCDQPYALLVGEQKSDRVTRSRAARSQTEAMDTHTHTHTHTDKKQ
jgi:hypothetical protein